MTPKSQGILYDIHTACDRILAHTPGVPLSEYERNDDLRDIVERNLIKIGDALSQLLKANPSYTARISDSSRIIGLRNRLTHGYRDVDDRLVYSAAVNDVPVLRREVAMLIQEQLSGGQPADGGPVT